MDDRLFNVFEKEIYDTKKLKQTEFEKGKHKEAWNKWGDIIKQTISKVDNDFKVVPHRWIIGQYLLQYFWFELKHKDRKNSASSISISIDKEQLEVYLEWNRLQSDKSVNNLEEHNRWINFIHSWINDYSININKFCVWVVNDNPEPITLNQFIYDSIEVERKIYQQQQNSTFSFRVGVILTRNEFLGLDNFESKLIEFLNQLKGIYQYTSLNAINDELEVAINKDIEVELSEENNLRLEGTVKHYFGKRYERDPINRKRAIEIHGLSCMGCGFNFEEVYGERGKDFIEVHHVKPLSTLEEEGVIDPEHDLVPVCSNCHRMIHRRKDNMLTVEKLKELVTDHFRGKM